MDGADVMPYELNPIFLLLVLLLFVLLSYAFVRQTGWKGWVALGGLLAVCVGLNPSKAEHVTRVQQQARAAPTSGASAGDSRHLMARFKSGEFEQLAEYHDLGVASLMSIQSKVLSFGLFGRVWVVKLQRLTYRPNRDVIGYRGRGELLGR